MQEITIKLTLDEANLVLEGLGNLPFAKVYALVAKIQAQANAQIAPAQRPAGESGALAPGRAPE